MTRPISGSGPINPLQPDQKAQNYFQMQQAMMDVAKSLVCFNNKNDADGIKFSVAATKALKLVTSPESQLISQPLKDLEGGAGPAASQQALIVLTQIPGIREGLDNQGMELFTYGVLHVMAALADPRARGKAPADTIMLNKCAKIVNDNFGVIPVKLPQFDTWPTSSEGWGKLAEALHQTCLDYGKKIDLGIRP